MPPKRRKSDADSLINNKAVNSNISAAATGSAGATTNMAGRRNWKQSFQALIDYRDKYGDCLVPSQYPEDSALGHWVRKQRRNENEGRLSDEKRQLLEDVGFVWKLRSLDDPISSSSHHNLKAEDSSDHPSPPENKNKKKRTWKEYYKALVEFQEETGHLAVNNDVTLSQWITKQRQEQDKLTRRQKKLLLDIGFDFELKSEKVERTWNEKFQELKQFKTKNGHTRVPDPCEEFLGLGSWANEQRKLWRGKRLKRHRVRALESIGFEKTAAASSSASSPSSRHASVPPNNKQRLLSTPTSPPTKKEKAAPQDNDDDDDNMDESPPSSGRKLPKMTNKKKFLTRFKALCEFQDEYGHTNPPRKEFQTLAYWVQRQKQLHQQDKLKVERQQLLNSIGFDWSLGPCNNNSNNPRQFHDMIAKLSLFQSQYGHLQVPTNYDRSGLDEWVEEMKQLGKEGKLGPSRAERLLRIGFTWEEDLVVWKEMFGHANRAVESFRWDSRKSLQLSEDLENWVKVQLLLLEYDLLTPKRKDMFESLSLAVQKSKVVIKHNPEQEEFQLKIETTPEQGKCNGLNLKLAALSWNPHGQSTKLIGSEPKTSPVNGKRKTIPIDIGAAVKKLKNGKRPAMDPPGVMVTSS